MFFCQFNMVMAKEQETCENSEQELRDKLAQVNEQLVGPYFNGKEFALIDAAYAPLFMRLAFLEKWSPMGILDNMPKMQRWSEALLARPAVNNSVVENLDELYRGHIGASGGYGARRFGGKA